MESKNKYLIPISIVISSIIFAGTWIYTLGLKNSADATKSQLANITDNSASSCSVGGVDNQSLSESQGIVLPVKWGDLGKQMVETGVIDKNKFGSIYAERGGLNEYEKNLLYGENNERLEMNEQNAGFLLNLLWALGIGNRNEILEKGPMADPRYGGAGNFASTGGWTVAKGDAMGHYSKHLFVILTAEQQNLVERVSKNIYRPCCGNSTYFPDCNHGMAMLGLLELMASQGVSEEDMYRAALQVNSYWFPDTYLNIAQYLEQKGIKSDEVGPKEILGVNFSSGSGYQRILKEISPVQSKSSGGCGV